MSEYLKKMLNSGKVYDDIIPINVTKYRDAVLKLRSSPEIPITSTGNAEMDNLVSGFERGRLYVISAPTKQGKTTLAQTIMYNMAQKNISSLIFSYEMSWQEITKKFMDMDLKTKRDVPTDIPIFFPLELHRGGGELQYQWLFEAVAKAKLDHGVQVAFIDHLHFLLPLRDYSNLSIIIGGVVREIKRMAVALDMSIVLITHIAKIKEDKVPDWTDIRDSSFITQEADAVWMLYRIKSKEAAKRVTDESTEDVFTKKAILSLELDRARGRTGKLKLWHNGAMFEPYTGQDGFDEFIKVAKKAYVSTAPDNNPALPDF